MKLVIMFLAVFLVSCTSAPIKNSNHIVKERDAVLNMMAPEITQCFPLSSEEISLEINFKLYDAQSSLLVKPKKIAYNPKTNADEIGVSVFPANHLDDESMNCVKDKVRSLTFNPVNPSYNYLVHHRFLMTIEAQDVVVLK